jgi:glycosyltransferase involved in cell wall biosynthesis
MKSLRVLIIRNAYQLDTGGAEQYAFNLALALKNAGHMPFVVTKHKSIHDKCAAKNICTIKGKWFESQEWGKHYYLRFFLMPLWYCWLIIRHRIDVVHPQSRDDFVFATNGARFLRKPVVWTDHADIKFIMDRVNHYHPRMQAWILAASRKVRAVVVVSKSELREITTVAPELKNKLVLVYNGVFLPRGVEAAAKTNKLIIGTNARLVPSKGIGELIDAVAGLRRKDIDLWIIGGHSGNLAKYKKQADKLGISNRVHMFGYVEMPNDYVASMDIFVHPSYHEAFSLAVVEAAMLGRPIVATNVGGTPEIIDAKCGVLVEPKDSKAIQTALEQLLTNREERIKLGEAAKKKATRDFDFQKIVEEKIIPLYGGK